MEELEHAGELIAHIVWSLTLLRCLKIVVPLVREKDVTVNKHIDVGVKSVNKEVD